MSWKFNKEHEPRTIIVLCVCMVAKERLQDWIETALKCVMLAQSPPKFLAGTLTFRLNDCGILSY